VAEGGLIYAVARDVTEEKAREARALRSQKLESLGRLTGGVAHDFNNLLTAIIGSLDMIQKRPEDAERRERLLAAALTAARRGEGLNKQLLGFARRQAVNTEFVCPDAFIADLKPLLEGAIGDVVRLRLDLRAAELGTCVDPAQFEAALLNLVVNARDAMPAGGDAVVSTALSDAADVERLGLPPGRYLSVQVRDTGVGMTQDVLAQVFEPFFTTKEVGKGTGLGLSQVYGFARQSGGGADVASTPGEGATVTMFLPLAEPAKRGAAEVAAEPASRPRALDVLLVEDDALVGVVTDSMLADLGCRVVRAEAGPEALRKLDEGRFDLLLTDVRMPGGMNGVQLAEEAVRRRPDLKVLLCSGWTADALGDELRGARWPLLAKPFDAARLERAIREVVGAET
jgi:CheY-like chemotaxis protein/nitrogen-specific signal transduction histidine kinase